MKMIGACVSDKGAVREVNQDAIVLKILSKGKNKVAVGGIFDGVGGLEHGEIASGLLKQELESWAEHFLVRIDLKEGEEEVAFSHFKDECERLNEVVRTFIIDNQIQTGSTMAVFLIFCDTYFLVNVGDSRIYRLNDVLEALTEDDVIVREKNGFFKRLLSNYIGKNNVLEYTEYSGKVEDGDIFLFCSDGFYHHLNMDDLMIFKNKKMNEKDIIRELKRLTGVMIERGEKDNISVGIVKCERASGGFFSFLK